MGARTLLYRLMVISPIALITWIVGTGRFATDSFEFAAATQKQHEAISAYQEVVRVTTPFRSRQYETNPDEVRAAAQMWIDGHESGKLQPLTPAFLGDSIQNGIKNEVRACQASLTLQLQQLALAATKEGRYGEALLDLRRALAVSQVLRSSDAIAESSCCQELGVTLARLGKLLPHLATEELAALRSDLLRHRNGAQPLDRLVRQTAVLMQQSQPELSFAEKWGTIVAQAKPKGTMSVMLTDYVATNPKKIRDMPPPIAQLYLGIRARESLNSEIDQTLDQISVLLDPQETVRVAALP